jgi:hypothetical protein
VGPNRGFNPDFMAEIINASPFTFPVYRMAALTPSSSPVAPLRPIFMRWMVRDEQKITLEEAHYRMSALPAHAAGFRDRGMLRTAEPQPEQFLVVAGGAAGALYTRGFDAWNTSPRRVSPGLRWLTGQDDGEIGDLS